VGFDVKWSPSGRQIAQVTVHLCTENFEVGSATEIGCDGSVSLLNLRPHDQR
jgi:hypothetical protein